MLNFMRWGSSVVAFALLAASCGGNSDEAAAKAAAEAAAAKGKAEKIFYVGG